MLLNGLDGRGSLVTSSKRLPNVRTWSGGDVAFYSRPFRAKRATGDCIPKYWRPTDRYYAFGESLLRLPADGIFWTMIPNTGYLIVSACIYMASASGIFLHLMLIGYITYITWSKRIKHVFFKASVCDDVNVMMSLYNIQLQLNSCVSQNSVVCLRDKLALADSKSNWKKYISHLCYI